MTEKLTQAKTDNFAIWSLNYSQLWLTDEEMQEIEFPPHHCCNALDQPKKTAEELRKTSFAYQKNLPTITFAIDLVEEFMNIFDRPVTEIAESTFRWQHSFITSRDGAKVIILAETDILRAFDKFGIKGAYGFAILAFAKLEIGETGPLSRSMTTELRETMELASLEMPFDIAITSLTKALDRQGWGVSS